MHTYTNVVLAVAALSLTAGSASAASAPYSEPFRPQFHYTPAKNWMNDPNGLVYYKGEYHLFYQYNPLGNEWGNMSWGHAVSPDLLHWSELPVALKAETNANGDVTQMFFSGSAVVDEKNTSGLGTPGTPPMVAVYTSLYPIAQTLANGKVVAGNTQAQSIAYSVDRGRTWKQYAGNPVIALPPAPYADQYQNFRDPKVFWYEPGKKWVMAAVLSALHKAVFFSSKDLKNWTFMSEFGPANGVGGVWECPDLFPLPVDGNNSLQKWVLMINLNPGGPAGGSGTQYFVGDFDGTRFTAQDTIDATPPAGTLFQGFEGSSYAALGWAATGDLVGQAPASGNLPGQGGVSGFIGARLANTFVNGDAATGTLTSPAFTITTPYINLLVGGGDHPHDPNSTYGPPPAGTLLFPGADFEGAPGATYEQLGWTATADMAGQPVATGAIADQQPVSGFLGRGLANTFVGSTRNEGGDAAQGTLTSPVFTIVHPYINFLIGGGAHTYAQPNPTAVVLKVNGVVVRSATGANGEALNWTNWNVSDLIGQQAQISIIDANTGGWGHINADQFLAADQPALPASTETAVNLLVDGQVVQSSTGSNSETLTWKNWSVGGYIGRKAQIQIVDRNTGGWGHILVDDIVFSTQPKEEAHWVDYGSDFYAAVTWNGIPDNKRVAVGWMSNWNYAGNTPTSPWRNAQSLPRELALKTVNGRLVLVQQPTQGLRDLRSGPMRSIQNRAIPAGSTPLPLKGRSLEIVAEFEASNAKQFGLKVRTGANGDETLVGYDAQTGEVFVDRSSSGIVDFDPSFTTRHSAPLPSTNGRVTLHVLVDASSVEVFGADGNARFDLGAEAVLTDLIYPASSSDGVSLFAVGGTANLRALRAWPLRSVWGH
jgi:sucrose-6-phosphate hydrolase SacC (GH32 family)